MSIDSILREEVERKVGRNILGLQRIEVLTKSLVGISGVSGYLGDLPELVSKKKSTVSKYTLGQATRQFLEKFCLPESEPVADREELTGIWVTMKCEVTVGEEEHARITGELRNLIGARNELVHHFFDRFDIGTDAGARAAVEYLDEQHEAAGRLWKYLEEIAVDIEELRALMAQYMSTDEYKEFLWRSHTSSGR